MLVRAARNLILSLAVLSVTLAFHAPDRPKAPLELTGRVVDRADLIGNSTEMRLTQQLARLEQDTGVQFVIVTTPSLNGRKIKDYGMALGNGWGLGRAERNDGLILLVAPRERQVRIEVGKGLERTLPNVLCQRIVQRMVPLFAAGHAERAIDVGEQALEQAVRAPTVRKAA